MRYKQHHSHTSKEHTYLCIAYKIHPVALFPFPVSFCKLSQALLFSQRTLPDNHAPHKPFEVHIQTKVKEQNSESYHTNNELNAFNCFESCLPLNEGNLTPKLR